MKTWCPQFFYSLYCMCTNNSISKEHNNTDNSQSLWFTMKCFTKSERLKHWKWIIMHFAMPASWHERRRMQLQISSCHKFHTCLNGISSSRTVVKGIVSTALIPKDVTTAYTYLLIIIQSHSDYILFSTYTNCNQTHQFQNADYLQTAAVWTERSK